MVTLLSDYEVCKEGDILTPEQARVLVSNVTLHLHKPVFPLNFCRDRIINFLVKFCSWVSVLRPRCAVLCIGQGNAVNILKGVPKLCFASAAIKLNTRV